MKWASWLNLIIGIWLLFSPWALHFGGTAAANNAILFGILAIIIAIWSLVAAPLNRVPAWINLVFGIWMFISAWAVAYAAGMGAVWNSVITGVLLFVFAVARMSAPRLHVGPTA